MTSQITTLPPKVDPAPKPLRFPKNLLRLLSNNLRIVPEQSYHENIVIAPGPPRMAFITGAKAVEEVLKDRSEEFPKGRLQNSILDPLFGDAMISSHGEKWRWQRKATAPLFRHDQIVNYTPLMRGAAEKLVEQWRQAPAGEERHINRDMMRVTFDVISNTMLVGGADEVISTIEKGHAEYFRLVNWWVVYRAMGMPAWLPRPGGKAMRKQEWKLRQSVKTLVEGRRSAAKDTTDLLGLLLNAENPETGQRMSDEEMVNNIVAFLVAGYDTTALALSWAIYLIARHPEWQDHIYQEVMQVAGEGKVGRDHLKELVVTDQVLNEALRLYPTAPLIVRDFDHDVVIDGVQIPGGTVGMIPIYAIHRHHSFWRDPDSFDPSRFAPDAEPKPSRYQYLPFGAGPRICLGATFATVEAKIMLATFVRAARFQLVGDYEPKPTGQMFLTASGDMPMRVDLR